MHVKNELNIYYYNETKIQNVFTGDLSVSYLNTRARFKWNEVDFSVFSTFSMITCVAGNLKTQIFWIRLVSRQLHVVSIKLSFQLILYV